ncbi:MAG: glycosyltransferase family 9 protein [Candidatus Hydrogenedentes bacterium]|nr:glycosyltransferase family 9 protein [Candidatus Hydrogenedentota bacterium]
MRILIIQTTRLGDVIQTTPLIHMVRKKHPDAHITLMVRRMGVPVAERNSDIDDIIVYDEDELYRRLHARDSNQLLEAYQIADERIRSLRAGNFDVCYNVTHSVSSAMLVKMAEIPEVYGAHLGDDWQFILRGNWTTYFFTSVFSREYNDLNLCDIIRNIVEGAPPSRALHLALQDDDRAFAADLLAQHGVREGDFVACFQLGASQDDKRWSAENFAALARLLKERDNAKIFLLGVESEQHLGDRFEAIAPGTAVHLFGKTSVAQVAALLERATVLVTNDTGTMHIAAAVNCPITLVSVGNVHYRETGPYGPGHCAIEARRADLGRSDYVPEGLEERQRIRADQVLAAIDYTLACARGDQLPLLDDGGPLESVDLFATRFAPDGCLEYYPAIRRPLGERDFMRIAYRAMWLAHLARAEDPEAEAQSLDAMLTRYDGPGADTVSAWAAEIGAHFEGLAGIADRGMAITEQLLQALGGKPDLERAKSLVAQLMAIDEEARVFSEVNPPCRPLILMARFERDNLDGADPRVLAQTTLEIYRACQARARLMVEKIGRATQRWGERP